MAKEKLNRAVYSISLLDIRVVSEMKFTLVSTVFNEASRLEQTIADLTAQTLQPSEIIVTDAGSTDGTYERLQRWKEESGVPIIIIVKPKCNVAEGRNIAIRSATFDLIASTDFGCRFHPGWLESLMRPFQIPEIVAVGGAFAVAEEDLQTLPAKAAYLLFNGYQDNIHDPHFTPTSRSVAYYRHVFDAIGGYPEWLTLAADDTIFGRVAKKKGIHFYMADEPYVYWGRHTQSIGYAKEAFRYGLGDGESHINKRSTVVKLAEVLLRAAFAVAVLLVTILWATGVASPLWYLVLIPFSGGFRPYIRHIAVWKKFSSEKYNTHVFLYSLYLMELTRYHYLRGYYQGYYQSPKFRQTEARNLEKLFAS